jgi:hypothetical protein
LAQALQFFTCGFFAPKRRISASKVVPTAWIHPAAVLEGGYQTIVFIGYFSATPHYPQATPSDRHGEGFKSIVDNFQDKPTITY